MSAKGGLSNQTMIPKSTLGSPARGRSLNISLRSPVKKENQSLVEVIFLPKMGLDISTILSLDHR